VAKLIYNHKQQKYNAIQFNSMKLNKNSWHTAIKAYENK